MTDVKILFSLRTWTLPLDVCQYESYVWCARTSSGPEVRLF